ncbi:hypothetical protein GQ43DRAFT_266704 [Delitschia confertaspora ATCC 74209]|uniref:Uncharacterized protein n=1 Tax=Delitschia confertaspora ATCC 74209 TaxID=1513339 RepID=A0A9P4JBL4_9PLEO|nr:hypothetical protein GQ43DRAFT_266704 [Delitschia confertaspora ATCC 74209]
MEELTYLSILAISFLVHSYPMRTCGGVGESHLTAKHQPLRQPHLMAGEAPQRPPPQRPPPQLHHPAIPLLVFLSRSQHQLFFQPLASKSQTNSETFLFLPRADWLPILKIQYFESKQSARSSASCAPGLGIAASPAVPCRHRCSFARMDAAHSDRSACICMETAQNGKTNIEVVCVFLTGPHGSLQAVVAQQPSLPRDAAKCLSCFHVQILVIQYGIVRS